MLTGKRLQGSEVLEEIADTERRIEQCKQQISQIPNFDILKAFGLIDTERYGEISPRKFQRYLETGDLYTSDQNVDFLFNKLDHKKDDKIDWEEFNRYLKPKEPADNFPNIRGPNSSDWTGFFEQSLMDLFQEEIRASKVLSLLKQEIATSGGIDAKELFDEIDQGQKGYLDPSDLQEYLKSGSKPRLVVREEAGRVFKYLDENKDGRIDYDEFLRVFDPQKPLEASISESQKLKNESSLYKKEIPTYDKDRRVSASPISRTYNTRTDYSSRIERTSGAPIKEESLVYSTNKKDYDYRIENITERETPNKSKVEKSYVNDSLRYSSPVKRIEPERRYIATTGKRLFNPPHYHSRVNGGKVGIQRIPIARRVEVVGPHSSRLDPTLGDLVVRKTEDLPPRVYSRTRLVRDVPEVERRERRSYRSKSQVRDSVPYTTETRTYKTRENNIPSYSRNFISDLRNVLNEPCQILRDRENIKKKLSRAPDFNGEDLFNIARQNFGNISKEKLQNFLKDISIERDENDISLLKKKYDIDQDGELNFDEFTKMLAPLSPSYLSHYFKPTKVISKPSDYSLATQSLIKQLFQNLLNNNSEKAAAAKQQLLNLLESQDLPVSAFDLEEMLLKEGLVNNYKDLKDLLKFLKIDPEKEKIKNFIKEEEIKNLEVLNKIPIERRKPERFIESEATSSPNIALIKYWGKLDLVENVPTNGSYSITLDSDILNSRTIATISPDFEGIQMELNGEPQPIISKHRKAVQFFKDKKRDLIDNSGNLTPYAEYKNWGIKIQSWNNFPTAAGMASSASGWSCLVVTLAKMFNYFSCKQPDVSIRKHIEKTLRDIFFSYKPEEKQNYKEVLEIVALTRVLGGSAARSLVPGMVLTIGPEFLLEKVFNSTPEDKNADNTERRLDTVYKKLYEVLKDIYPEFVEQPKLDSTNSDTTNELQAQNSYLSEVLSSLIFNYKIGNFMDHYRFLLHSYTISLPHSAFLPENPQIQANYTNFVKNLRIAFLVFNSEKKLISSTSGMVQTVRSSAFYPHRIKGMPKKLSDIAKYVENGDFSKVHEAAVVDSNSFHSSCLDTIPPIMYMNQDSYTAIRLVNILNEYFGDEENRYPFGYTFDAGPNCCVVTQKKMFGWFLLSLEFLVGRSRDFFQGDLSLLEEARILMPDWELEAGLREKLEDLKGDFVAEMVMMCKAQVEYD